MKARAEIEAGVCGFKTTATAVCEDGQNVTLDVQSDCDKIRKIGEDLKAAGAIDAYQEINPAGQSVVMRAVHATLKGCCAGCAAPAGVFKAMQVAAGLALPQDISIRLTQEP
jgi:hypothetical protein